MIKFLKFVIAPIVLLSTVPAHASDLEGLWLTPNQRSVIKVEKCGEHLCGQIHWIIEGGMQYDQKNPVESQRTTAMCGLKVLWGVNKKNDKRWDGGQIYKADDGDTYSANVELVNPDKLKIRGYLGLSFLGKTQHWTRVSLERYPKCTVPK